MPPNLRPEAAPAGLFWRKWQTAARNSASQLRNASFLKAIWAALLRERTCTLLFCNLNNLISASEAADNPDLAVGNAEMLCQQLDDCLVGLAFLGRFLDFDYKAIAFLAKLFGLRTGLYLNLDFHPPILPIFPGYEILPV